MKFVTNSQRILNELFTQDFNDNSSYINESQFFEFFASKQILKYADLSDEEIEKGVVGDKNDGGCDSIYIIYNGNNITEDIVSDINMSKESTIELIIIQAKKETSFCEDTIMKWKTISKNLLEIGVNDAQFLSRYNEDVRNAFSVFRDLYVKLLRNTPKLVITFYYATFASETHKNVIAQAEELKKIVHQLFPNARVEVKFWGADELLHAAQSQPECKLSLQLAETPINIGTHHDYIALVNLAKYFNFITDNNKNLRKYLFDSNVRDYQGHNAVNQDIHQTLHEPSGEDFWWLNNGITLLTDEAILATSKEIVLVEPTIVNGLQTSNEIYHHYQENPNLLESEKRNILIRIIVPESEDSRDRIILATNNQTSIPKSSLRANDPIHWQIELFLRNHGLFYDRRKNYYKNQGKKSSEIVSVSFLAQCMISLLLQKPNYARARPSTLLTKDDTYEALYVKNKDLDVFYNSAMLGKKIESCLKKSLLYSSAQRNDILFYVIYYSVAKKLGKVTIVTSDIKGLNLDYYNDDYIIDIASEVFAEYDKLGGDGRVAKGPDLIDNLISKLTA